MGNFLLVISLFFWNQSFGARWIVEGGITESRSYTIPFEVKGEIRFGQTKYLVIETPDYIEKEGVRSPITIQSIKAGLGTENLFPDLEIGLPRNTEIHPIRSGVWHIDRLQYKVANKYASGKGVIVAVLDTGVDWKHPALKNQMWVNKEEIANNGIDDDKNGFIDDIYGFDFDDKDGDPMDQYNHGTHCAGIIAAEPHKKSNARGIARSAKIMAIRILGRGRKGFLSNAAAGIVYAVDNGAQVLSNSWRIYKTWKSYDPSEKNIKILKDAIKYAREKGVIFVAAAGNERKNIDTLTEENQIFPVGFRDFNNMVGVAATNKDDVLARFSNYGKQKVHVAAPGDRIFSTVRNGKWRFMSGTSMATPIVSGALALGLSAGMEAEEAVKGLYETSDGKMKRKIAFGHIDVVKFLQ